MNHLAKTFTLSACAVAASMLISACGGADTADTVAPTVAITDSVSAATASGPVTFTFTFSEDVGTSFTAEDITVTGGIAGAFTRVSGTVATLVVTPPANATGSLAVSVAAAKFKDLALNDNTVPASASQEYNTVVIVTPPPAGSGTVLASFDEATPPAVTEFGGAVKAIVAGPVGGNGNALKITRNGGEPYAGAWISIAAIPNNAGNQTISARVYSPTAGIPMVAKAEFGDNTGTGDVSANETVVVGWQTLTWTFTNLAAPNVYNRFVILPNLGAVDTAKDYYVDDITLTNVEPPVSVDDVLASFDEATPPAVTEFGGAVKAIVAGPVGGNGNALKITRNGGEPYAGAWVSIAAIPNNAGNQTISARVYSPTAGIPMVAKAEFGDNTGTGDVSANETVVVGWQTLTWTFTNLAAPNVYNRFVILPNLGAVDTAKDYFVDDITLIGGGAGGGGGGGGGGVTPNPSAAAGSFGPVTIPVLTGSYLNNFGVAGDAVFAGDYVGSLQSNGNKAGWESATTFGVASNGNIGYFQDGLLSGPAQSAQKLEENGWVAGLTSLSPPPGVPSFFRFFILQAPASTFANSYMGLYANAPNNGTVDISTYGSIKFKAWGPAQMYQESNFAPTLEMKLTGPKIEGCTATGSGATEIRKTFVANQKIGAGSDYKLSLAGWTVAGVCGTDTTGTAVASVLSKLAQVVLTVPGSSFNFTNLNSDGITYTTGVNLGPIIFTAN